MPISAVFLNLASGATIDEIIEQFDISREEIEAVLELAAHSSEGAPFIAPATDSPVDAHSF